MASERLQRQIERLLDEADLAITSEDWLTVASRARSVLRIDPENSDALSYLAITERDIGAPDRDSSTESPTSQALPPTSSTTDQPSSFANSRYEVKRFLGEGGKLHYLDVHGSTYQTFKEVLDALDNAKMKIVRKQLSAGTDNKDVGGDTYEGPITLNQEVG